MEGSAPRAEPSTLRPETVEGSIPQTRTLHETAPHHGRFSIQSGTIHAEARNRGRFHSSDPFRRPVLQTRPPGPSPRPEPLRCLIRSRQFNMPVGMELTTSSARQDTSRQKAGDSCNIRHLCSCRGDGQSGTARALSGTVQGNADEHTVGILLGPVHCR